MHFKVLVGTRFGWEEVDELLLPYFSYFGRIPTVATDPRFVFKPVNLEEAFEEEKSRNPHLKEYYEKYKNAQDWAEEDFYLSYEEDRGWGYWKNPLQKGFKWDGWLIGGRWTGFFLLKEGTKGLLGELNTKSPTDLREADQARKCDIDWEAMGERGRREAEELWARSRQSKDPYHRKWGYGLYPRDTKESFIDREGLFAGTPFAVLMDGNWIERVEGGWATGDEKSMSEWRERFQSLLEKIPDDAVVTLVDCHI